VCDLSPFDLIALKNGPVSVAPPFRGFTDSQNQTKALLAGAEGIDNNENGYIDYLYGYDFANDDGEPLDDYGHGTHIAGTIAIIKRRQAPSWTGSRSQADTRRTTSPTGLLPKAAAFYATRAAQPSATVSCAATSRREAAASEPTRAPAHL